MTKEGREIYAQSAKVVNRRYFKGYGKSVSGLPKWSCQPRQAEPVCAIQTIAYITS